jgi:hypothetical protein
MAVRKTWDSAPILAPENNLQHYFSTDGGDSLGETCAMRRGACEC